MNWLRLFKRRVKVIGIGRYEECHYIPQFYYHYIWRWQKNDYNEVNA